MFYLHTETNLIEIIIIHSLKLFTLALGDGFSMESEWQQVSSNLQDSFQILSVLFCGQPRQQSRLLCNFSFLLIIIKSGLLAEIRWSVCMPKSYRSLCVSFSRTGAGLCIYHLFVWSNFLHISQWITLPTQSCLVLYSFCANLLHSLIMWLMVSSLIPLPAFALLLSLIYSRFDMNGS